MYLLYVSISMYMFFVAQYRLDRDHPMLRSTRLFVIQSDLDRGNM